MKQEKRKTRSSVAAPERATETGNGNGDNWAAGLHFH